jgi:Family of unknown function (DUF5372)
VAVTDPRHPLYGQRLRVLSLSCSRGPRFIAVALADGRRRLIRRAATELERPAEPERAMPRISVRTLLPLARHIRRVVAASAEEASHVETCSSLPASVGLAIATSATPLADAAAAGPHAIGPADGASAPAPSRGGASC